ncbi:MAG: mechanosensitive ion channel [Candidatus Cloacimonadaceae bacterium]|jgi:small-conductance mechanosensitive channel|nr:mechanosensitive ion channel family protein [Candidatus Cloacimonadota bacterium]MDY0126740.1 mechanosensitive ion channel [Candidatus Cloacimonadaceae bacterium]MCB5255677.1 mechanosensitive ion channel family protein [Candidatus Cloacimonadota bacterium]MCK9178343.1 mechanosensitive ion channel family protein [Candidatus Cloacimonadota bacterium]MCK9241920.1 mechanosensitive ion channel family protein [Candidatus Cloacimonadota bacterium]
MEGQNVFTTLAKLVQGRVFSNVITSLILIFVLWMLNRIARKVIEKRVRDLRSQFSWRKSITYTFVLIGFLVVGRVWFEGIQSLATFLGLLSAGIAIALKEVFADLAGWIFILTRKPFDVGNRIQIGEHSGDVIDIRPFQFTMLEIGNWVQADQSTGRMIHIPNGFVFTQPLSNYDKGFKFIWNEIPVLITFESDWRKAKQILHEIADSQALSITPQVKQELKETSRKFLITYNILTTTVYTSVLDSGVLLTIRYLSEIRSRRCTTEDMWESILEEFAKHSDVELAYPTYRKV